MKDRSPPIFADPALDGPGHRPLVRGALLKIEPDLAAGNDHVFAEFLLERHIFPTSSSPGLRVLPPGVQLTGQTSSPLCSRT